MANVDAAPGWYPDPEGSGGQRYFDGAGWTAHRAPPPQAPAPFYPPNSAWGYGYVAPAPPWKGALLGRPASGPGSLADPGRRFAARLLDSLIMIPVFLLITAIAIALVAPHVGAVFPSTNPDPNVPAPVPGFVWIMVAVYAAVGLSGVLVLLYEAIATGSYGRTLGKRWMRIRPVRIDGAPIGWGRSFGRAGIYWAAGFLGWIGLINPLWCLWDANHQCLHDKAVGTIVVND